MNLDAMIQIIEVKISAEQRVACILYRCLRYDTEIRKNNNFLQMLQINANAKLSTNIADNIIISTASLMCVSNCRLI